MWFRNLLHFPFQPEPSPSARPELMPPWMSATLAPVRSQETHTLVGPRLLVSATHRRKPGPGRG